MRMHGRACVNGDLRYSSELQLLPLPAQLRFSLVDRGTWCRSARVFRSSVRFFFCGCVASHGAAAHACAGVQLGFFFVPIRRIAAQNTPLAASGVQIQFPHLWARLPQNWGPRGPRGIDGIPLPIPPLGLPGDC